MLNMKRREFIALLGGGAAAAWPRAARAQTKQMRRIGVLMPLAADDPLGQARFAALREGLEKLGWIEGRNIRIDTRWTTTGDVESMQRYAKELVALQPDLIVTQSTPITATLLQETRTIPIVFALVADPIGSGFVASFAKPGGNAPQATCRRSTVRDWRKPVIFPPGRARLATKRLPDSQKGGRRNSNEKDSPPRRALRGAHRFGLGLRTAVPEQACQGRRPVPARRRDRHRRTADRAEAFRATGAPVLH